MKWVGGVLATLGALGFYVSERLIHMPKKSAKYLWERETDDGFITPESFERLPKTTRTLVSPFGYDLYVQAVEFHPASKRWVILSHGVRESSVAMVKYMNLFVKRGYNAVLYDHRRHGDSGGKTISYGYFEKEDLQCVVDWLFDTYGNDLYFGLFGESMGAVTTLLYAGELEDRAQFYIVDCPFSALSDQVALQLKRELRFPKFTLHYFDWFVRMRGRFSMRDVSPLQVVGHIQNPVLFIHSEHDDFIPVSMTRALYEKKQGAKSLFIAPHGGHAESFVYNQEAYKTAVNEFLDEVEEKSSIPLQT